MSRGKLVLLEYCNIYTILSIFKGKKWDQSCDASMKKAWRRIVRYNINGVNWIRLLFMTKKKYLKLIWYFSWLNLFDFYGYKLYFESNSTFAYILCIAILYIFFIYSDSTNVCVLIFHPVRKWFLWMNGGLIYSW